MEPTRPIFAVFEGGGAAGVAHVGALHAVEDNGLEIVGVAGTSAGALIAVLVAIGYDAENIMSSSDARQNIVAARFTSVVRLLGSTRWWLLKRLEKWAAIPLAVTGLVGAVIASIIAPLIATTLGSGFRRKGHFATPAIQEFINAIICERLASINRQGDLGKTIPQRPTFGDLAGWRPDVIPLKIIATNVDLGKLQIFDEYETPDVVVAEAVAASIAIPFAFQPTTIPSLPNPEQGADGSRSNSTHRFADGGIVANFPIWSFAEEKLAFERQHADRPSVPIIGFELTVPDYLAKSASNNHRFLPRRAWAEFRAYLSLLLKATLRGSQGTSYRFLEDVTIIPVASTLGLLDFDATPEAFLRARDQGLSSAYHHLRFTLDTKPDLIRRELSRVRDLVLASVNRLQNGAGLPVVDQLRITIIKPNGNVSLRVMESVGMDATDTDDRLLLDHRGVGAAQAFREKGLRQVTVDREIDDPHRFYMTKYERALVRPTIRTMLCLPIFADPRAWDVADEALRSRPYGVLAIDSDADLAVAFRHADLRNTLVRQSAILYAAVNRRVDDA